MRHEMSETQVEGWGGVDEKRRQRNISLGKVGKYKIEFLSYTSFRFKGMRREEIDKGEEKKVYGKKRNFSISAPTIPLLILFVFSPAYAQNY